MAKEKKGRGQILGYKRQYGLTIVCKDEAEQKLLFSELKAKGLKVKVVVV